MDPQSEKQQPLFDRLYSATKDTLRQMKKPYARRKLKRSLQSALDSAESQKIDAQGKIDKVRETISESDERYDINVILEHHSIVKRADETITLIKEEYRTLFDEEIDSK